MTARPPRWLRALARVAGAAALAVTPAGPAAAQAFDSTAVEWHIPDREARQFGLRRIAPGLLVVSADDELETPPASQHPLPPLSFQP